MCPSEREDRLDEVIAEYLKAVDAGQRPDREEFLARYSDLEAELRRFFRAQDGMDQLMGGERASTESVLGDYELIEELGRGGMGVVYKARQKSLERIVALKTILPDRMATNELLDRFRREARAAARIRHANIVQVYEVSSEEGVQFYSMEYVDGPSLDQVVARARAERDERDGGGGSSGTRSRAEEVRRTVEQIASLADGLEEAHRQGLVHRDVKPSNILVDSDGRYRLVDFGLVRDAMDETITRTGSLLGTLHYMSPEQMARFKVDARSDVYSLGVTLYEMLTLSVPFGERSEHEVPNAILTEDPIPPRKLNPVLSRDLETIVLKALHKQPVRRYPSAAEFGADLRRYLRGESIRARRRSSFGRLVQRASRYKGWVAAALLLILVPALNFWWPDSSTAPVVGRPRLISSLQGSCWAPSFSPDGERIAYINSTSGVAQVWVRDLGGASPPVQVTFGEVAAGRPRWSPTGGLIAFTRLEGEEDQDGSVWTVAPPLAPRGHPPRMVLDPGRHPSWSRDGSRIVYERKSEVWIANADGSEASVVASIPPLLQLLVPRFPALSPDGTRIAYFQTESGYRGDFWTAPIAGGQARRLTHDVALGGAVTWEPKGRFLVFQSQRQGAPTLWKVATAGGEPEPVTVGGGEDSEPEISLDGRRLIYTNTRTTYTLSLWDAETKLVRSLLDQRTRLAHPRFSPDGTTIAYFTTIESQDQLLLIGADGSRRRRVSQPREVSRALPDWSADGSHLYFYGHDPSANSPFSFCRVPLQGDPTTVIASGWNWGTQRAATVHEATGRVAYTLWGDGGTSIESSRIRDLKTGIETDMTIALRDLHWSSDGKTLVGGHGLDDREATIWIYPVDGDPVELTTGIEPMWSRDESVVCFLRNYPDDVELWTIQWRGDDKGREKLVARLGWMSDDLYDISPTGDVVWVRRHQSDKELWIQELSVER